jgi:hypothetical protein
MANRLPHIRRGDEVLVGDGWYPVAGYSLTVRHDSPTTGSVFTAKKYGKLEPCLGYRINYADISDVRAPR